MTHSMASGRAYAHGQKLNRTKDKIIKPSFLIEVMALQVLRPPFGGDFPYEFMGFFATMADRVVEDWPEPAGLGPPVAIP